MEKELISQLELDVPWRKTATVRVITGKKLASGHHADGSVYSPPGKRRASRTAETPVGTDILCHLESYWRVTQRVGKSQIVVVVVEEKTNERPTQAAKKTLAPQQGQLLLVHQAPRHRPHQATIKAGNPAGRICGRCWQVLDPADLLGDTCVYIYIYMNINNRDIDIDIWI